MIRRSPSRCGISRPSRNRTEASIRPVQCWPITRPACIMCLEEVKHRSSLLIVAWQAESFVRAINGTERKGKDQSDVTLAGPDTGNTKDRTFPTRAFDRRPEGVRAPTQMIRRCRSTGVCLACQNLETEHNTTPLQPKTRMAGFTTPAPPGGSSAAGATATGGLRSYASMTYSVSRA